MCASPAHASTKILLKGDTAGVDIECERIANILFNSAEWYYDLSEVRQLRIDALKSSLKSILGVAEDFAGTEEDLVRLSENYNSLDETQKQQIAALTKEVGKLTRRKNFWKTVSFIEAGLGAALAVLVLLSGG
jgi:hypothetical protein